MSTSRASSHATEDQQAVRDRVYATLATHEFRVDATVFDKPKVRPQLRESEATFYKHAWFYHLKHLAPLVAQAGDELVVVAAALGTKSSGQASIRPFRTLSSKCPRR